MHTASNHVDRTIRVMTALGFHLASAGEIIAGRAAAAALVGEAIASAKTMLRVQTRSRCAVFIADTLSGGIAAAVSAIPLALAAISWLEAGRFDGLNPSDPLIARPCEAPCAFYIWGCGGFTWRGRLLALAASVAFQREAYPGLPLYARAATEDGARVLQQRLGARPLPGGLMTAPAWAGHRKAA